jgi:hypothetical protein
LVCAAATLTPGWRKESPAVRQRGSHSVMLYPSAKHLSDGRGDKTERGEPTHSSDQQFRHAAGFPLLLAMAPNTRDGAERTRVKKSPAVASPAVPTCAQWAAFPNLSVQRNSRAPIGYGYRSYLGSPRNGRRFSGLASRSAVRRPCNRRFAPFARNPSQPSLIPAEPWDREWMRPTVEPALPVRGSAQKNSCPINRQQVHSC